MDMAKYIEKLNIKINKKRETIKDYTESNNPELINTIPIYEKEIAENEIVLMALEKQVPKKVKKSTLSGQDICPSCGRLMVLGVEGYCDKCGQRLEVNE